MRSGRVIRAAAVGVGLLGGADARAGGGPATDAYDGIRERPLDVHGLLDVYLQHDGNRPPSGVTAYRPFDLATDAPSLGLLRVTVAHRPDPVGFRIDAGVGDLANEYLRSDPAYAEHPGLSRALSYAEQVYATAVIPVGHGLAVDVGKFGTPVGLEDNESSATWSYSRSLLYTLAEPSFHAGVRATYPVTDTLALSAFVLNGWNTNLLAGDGLRSLGAAVGWRPFPALTLSLVELAGPERAPTRLADSTLTFRNELDASAIYRLTEDLTLAVTADHGYDRGDGGVTWWGVAGYVRARVLPWLAATVRGERLADPDGYVSGARQRVAELTATLEVRRDLGEELHLAARLEYRRDQSDARVFESDGPRPLAHRDTVAAALIAWF